jgi:FkbM family methyltransferase
MPDFKYLGFEPNSSCIAYIQELIRINNYQYCTIHNCALSTKAETLILEKSYAEDSRASVVSSLRPDYFKNKESIISLDFDSFFSETQIVFVKIDVEGAELDVIQGMKQSIVKNQPLITCEVLDSHHPSVTEFTQNRAEQLCKLIHSLNYSIVQLQTKDIGGKITGFKKIDIIAIKQWTPASLYENDYLFYPDNMEIQVLEKLKALSN